MPDITCPNCGSVINLDDTGYEMIANQVRTEEFNRELERRINEKRKSDAALFESDKQQAVLAVASEKDKEIAALKQQLDNTTAQLENGRLQYKIGIDKAKNDERTTSEQKLGEMREIVYKKDSEISALKERLGAVEREKDLLIERARNEEKAAGEKAILSVKDELSQKTGELALLQQKMSMNDEKKNFEINEAVRKVEADRDALLKEYEIKLKSANEQVEYYKDLKSKMSTKMIGETLEQHCENSFNAIRMAAFPRAQFGKDNEVSRESGSKGDYIFRDFDETGLEYLSIMFEMKNEADTTSTKKKNENFFKELDKDRQEKNCEYAVLVSLLESDSELYNQGIVDVSYRYPKMYVIRPQFFIPLISILRNAALHTVDYKRQLQIYKNQNMDVTNFESKLEDFKARFSKNYELASRKFTEAIAEIDKTIDHLQKTKAALLSSENNLRLANDKADDLTIKKLTRNNPTMKQLFDQARAGGEE